MFDSRHYQVGATICFLAVVRAVCDGTQSLTAQLALVDICLNGNRTDLKSRGFA